METLQTHIKKYLEHCQYQKRLDAKTLKAYRIDLTQFNNKFAFTDISEITPQILEEFIAALHQEFNLY